jgi:ABC-type amino acid transport substrate-binding protein
MEMTALKVVDMTPYAVGGFCYLLKKDNTTVKTLEDLNSESVIMANGEGTGTLTETSKKYPKAKHRFALKGSPITAIAGTAADTFLPLRPRR